MKRYILFLACTMQLIYAINAQAAEWQWSTAVRGYISAETNEPPRAFLWIPPTCHQVRAVIFGMHNMSEETLFENKQFRRDVSELDFAIIWITPGLDMNWNAETGVQEQFEQIMDDLADRSGYQELRNAPIVPIGHSAMATFPWNFAAWNPERTLAVISLHGDAPRTNLTGHGRENIEWGKRTIDGIPGLMIEGEYEWWENRVIPALAFRLMYPHSTISFLCDAGHGHFDVSAQVVDYISLFLKKAALYRLPANIQPQHETVKLKRLNPEQGWLAERWRQNGEKRAVPAPFTKYKGDKHDAFWYFDEEMALETERIYAHEKNKQEQYIGFMQQGKMLPFNPTRHARIVAKFIPETDGLTFHLKPVYTDSLRTTPVTASSAKIPRTTRICGPVEVVNDTTFTVRFYRMGMNNPKRTGDIWLCAESDGDTKHKSTVQQINIRIPYRNTEGIRQHILFPGLPDITTETESVSLSACSDCGLPVYYYVKEGPAEIKDGKIVLTTIPPRAKYPIKVTVVAWQYGIAGKTQTAEPVERSFYITK